GIGGLTAFGNRYHNVIGLILGGLFPFSLIPFAYSRRPLEKGISIFLIVLGFLATFMTLSRGTWAGVMVTFLLWGAYRNWKLIAGGLTVLVVSVFLFGPNSIAERAGLLEKQIGTASGRTPIWEVALGQIMERPLLGYGYGPGTFTAVYEEGRTHQPGEESNVPHEHNLFISLLIQNGVVGLSLYLWFFGVMVFNVFRMIGRIESGIDREILVVIVSGLIGEYLIHAMLERNNVGNWAIPFWAMTGMAMAILNRSQSNQGAPTLGQIGE
ncbi:MAG: O-antigen ligase domain-containing protein, partial [Candidatus Manganitrophaceae bacterium]